MPYIKDYFRSYPQSVMHRDGLVKVSIDDSLNDLIYIIKNISIEDRCGVVNYCVTRLIAEVFKSASGWKYFNLNMAYGTFFSAAAEFYRRVVAPYEDKCIKKNGDIPEYSNVFPETKN